MNAFTPEEAADFFYEHFKDDCAWWGQNDNYPEDEFVIEGNFYPVRFAEALNNLISQRVAALS